MMQEDEFIELISHNKNNVRILDRIVDLNMNDVWLVSGALFQTIWNHQTKRDPTNGIKDYDVFYFDESDLSWDAEDRVIQHVNDVFKDLKISIEVRNQARVHLWYEKRFGRPYPPLTSSCDGIDRFLAKACMVGLQPGNSLRLYAPQGLDDLEDMIVRPNITPNFSVEHYNTKAKRWKELWPELRVESPVSGP